MEHDINQNGVSTVLVNAHDGMTMHLISTYIHHSLSNEAVQELHVLIEDAILAVVKKFVA